MSEKPVRADECVALWYIRYHSPGYWLFDSEEDAARAGAYVGQNGEAVVLGVQFADGRSVAGDDWDALRAAEAERDRLEEEAWRTPSAPRPMREICDPFNHYSLKVAATEPSWLGETDAEPGDLPDAALPAAADYIRDVADELESRPGRRQADA